MISTDFLIGAPKFITNRFSSINKYVWQTLCSEQTIKEKLIKFETKAERRNEIARLKTISNEASTLVFLFLLNKLFLEGAKAAKQAVDTFKDLNVDGFYIGHNYFTERNDNVVQGDKISEQLIATIQNEKARKLVTQSKYVYEILDEYRKFI
jgi:hypothetical protein